MKRITFLYVAVATALVVLLLTRFGHFAIDGTNIWGKGSWITLLPFTYLMILFSYMTYLESKVGGWTGYVDDVLVTDDKPVRFYQASYFWLAVGSLVFDCIIFFGHLGDK